MRGYGATGRDVPVGTRDSTGQQQQEEQPQTQPQEPPQEQQPQLTLKQRLDRALDDAATCGLWGILLLTAILAAVVVLNVAYAGADGLVDEALRALGTLFGTCAFASTFLCIKTDPGSPHADPDDGPQQATAEEAPLPPKSRQREQKLEDGQVWVQKFCRHCKLWRPYGAGHCRYCNRCVLHLDHHCIILGTCIGERNQIFFDCLLLFGGLSLLCWFCLTVRCCALGWWRDADWWHLLIIADFTLMSGSSGLALTCFGVCSTCCRCFDPYFQWHGHRHK